MADNVVDIKVKINAETGQLEVLVAKFRGAAAGADQASKSFLGLSKEAQGLAAELGLVFGAGEVLSFLKESVKAGEEAAQAQNRLKFAVEATGGSFEVLGAKANEWASAIQETTRFEDTVAIETLERFMRVTGDMAQAQRAASLAMDLNVQSGKPLAQTTQLVTDLIIGSTRSVKEARSEFNAFVGNATTTQQVLDRLRGSVSGAAVSEQSLTKDTAGVTSEFHKWSEQLGQTLAPMIRMVTPLITGLLKVIQEMTLVFQGGLKGNLDAFVGAVEAGKQALTGHFADAGNTIKKTWSTVKDDAASTAKEVSDIWKKSNEDIAKEAGKGSLKARDSEAVNAKAAENARRTIEMEAEVNQAIARLGEDTYQHKINLLNAEFVARRQKTITEFGSERAAAQALISLEREKTARVIELARLEAKAKRELAYNTVDTIGETLGIINSLHNAGTQGELNRARIILALEKTIAIARIWSAAAGNPAMVAIAAAQTALVAAQFAQQSRALGQAQQSFNEGQNSVSVSTPLDDGTGRNVTVGSGGGGRAFLPGPGAPAAAGGINQTFIFNLSFESLNTDNVRPLATMLADLVRKSTAEGMTLAKAIDAAGTRSAGVAP